jgi:hypothetical protein
MQLTTTVEQLEEPQKIILNWMNRIDFNKQQQKETTQFNLIEQIE